MQKNEKAGSSPGKAAGGEELDKNILEQYTSMQAEQKDIRRRIENLKDDIRGLEENRSETADSVTCGRKGKKALKTVKISGFPEVEYQTKIGRLKKLRMRLELADDQLLELLSGVEEYVESIEDSRMRLIMRYRYMDNMTWKEIARRMRGGSTADSIRMEHNRFLEKK